MTMKSQGEEIRNVPGANYMSMTTLLVIGTLALLLIRHGPSTTSPVVGQSAGRDGHNAQHAQ